MAAYVKQHYIPQFWLNYFADENGYVNYFNKRTSTELYLATKEIFYYKNLYDDNRFGDDIKKIEKNFSILEGRIKPLFDRLQNGREIVFTKEEYKQLLIFLHVQTFRNKRGYNDFKKYSNDEKVLKQIKNIHQDLDNTLDAWRTVLLEYSNILTTSDLNDFHKASRAVRDQLKMYTTEYHFNVFEVKGDTDLILSDTLPLTNTADTPFGKIPVVLYYPISKKRLLIVSFNDLSYFKKAKPLVSINKLSLPYSNTTSYKFRVSTLYEKEVNFFNEQVLKYYLEGYIK